MSNAGVRCAHCGPFHTRRPDGSWPRCRQNVDAPRAAAPRKKYEASKKKLDEIESRCYTVGREAGMSPGEVREQLR